MAKPMIQQYDIYYCNFDPQVGAEVSKTRPCIIVSPNDINMLQTVIVVPITNTQKDNYPMRFHVSYEKASGYAMVEQIKAIDKSRLNTKVCSLNNDDIQKLKDIIQEMLID